MDRDRIWQLVDSEREFLVSTRRAIHAHPELSFKEAATASLIEQVLLDAGYQPRIGIGSARTGVSAVLEGGLPGPTIALRADTDALPIDEQNELSFRSRNPGVMHACGHDGHTAILLATARALKAVQPEIRGRVFFLFQHAEELPPGGAIELIEAGCLDGVDAAFGLHLAINLDAGQIVVAPGPRAASSDTFSIEVRGRGGHGAFPHLTVDAVQVAAELVTSLHQIVSRRVNPLEPAVITVGTLQAGTKDNIIADAARLTGTVRAFSESVRELLNQEIESVAQGVTSAWGATFEMEYSRGYPVLSNDGTMSELAARAAERALGEPAVGRQREPMMGAEDFAHYLDHVPGAFAFLGSGRPEVPLLERSFAHSAGFLMEEGSLPVGLAWYLSLVTNFDELRAELS